MQDCRNTMRFLIYKEDSAFNTAVQMAERLAQIPGIYQFFKRNVN